MKKTCTKCKETKDADKFSKARATKDGRESECKECRRLYRMEFERKKLEKSGFVETPFYARGDYY